LSQNRGDKALVTSGSWVGIKVNSKSRAGTSSGK